MTTGQDLTRHQLQYLVPSCYRAADTDDRLQRGALVHALRHTFATRVVAAGSLTYVALRHLAPDG
ncbi:hypothetical protein [Kineococcus sp. SYSU DK018]|uniref:hypothetical protein n=1 Tax=Kineococcus sp. SYSU DK018 TaxID=3383139 RepID=UPI003D7C6639